MPDMKWTPAQQRAIGLTGRSLLVSAAAGSGKTATLTERIVRSLTERGGDLSRMLIVTFTRAAAAELRARIARALETAVLSAPSLRRQLYLLENAKICTIHSFCLDVLQPNFDRAGLPARFRTLENAEVKILRRRVMDELISDCYDDAWGRLCPDAAVTFPRFADCFLSGRGDEEGLIDLFLSLYETMSAYPDGTALWDDSAAALERAAEREFLTRENPYAAVILRGLTEFAAHYTALFSDFAACFPPEEKTGRAYLPAITADLAFLGRLTESLGAGYAALRPLLSDYVAVRLGPLRAADRDPDCDAYRAARDAFKKELDTLGTRFFAASPGALAKDCRRSAAFCRAGGIFLREFETRYAAAKRRVGAIDYTDMEHLTLGLLYDAAGEKTDLARELAARYDEIYIDEYQDVNAVQDRIFSAVAREDNRFMVGDIKQSIYGFRGALPDLFAGYRRAFSEPGAPGETIFMSENFRSDASVIDFTNAVFDPLLTAAGASIDYRPDDRLLCGKDMGGRTAAPVQLLLCETGRAGQGREEDDLTSAEREAEAVACEIRRLLDCEKRADGTPLRPGDIAILLRNGKKLAEPFAAALARHGIPAAGQGDDRFFENPEVLLMRCLLSVIDNPKQDVYLLGLLLSPLCAFTLDELVTLRRAAPAGTPLIDALRAYTAAGSFPKGEKLLADLAHYRRLAAGAPCDRLIWQLYRECGVMAVLEAGSDAPPARRRANLLALYEYARAYEAHGYRGLYSFIRYLDGLIEADTPLPAPSDTGEGDRVRLMTVHASKGLEFPVCFVCGCGRKYNDREAGGSLLFDRTCGIAMRLRVQDHIAWAETALRAAVAARLTERAHEEELRVLYVALTRARERLYLTAALPAPDDALAAARDAARLTDRYTVLRATRYIDLVLTALSSSPCPACRIDILPLAPAAPAPGEVSKAEEAAPVPPPDPLEVARLTDLLGARLSYRYPYAHLADLPAKLSVSKLYPGVLDDDEGVRYASGEAEERAALTLAARPAFLGGDAGRSAADAGTATHVFLQFCDFAALARSPEAERDRLVAAGFLGAEMAAAVRMEEIAAFAVSPLFSELRQADRLWREQRFNLRLPAAPFSRDPVRAAALSGETLLVQGVIDCFFLSPDGRLTLVDYKTDRLSPAERADPALAAAAMRRRHGTQLGYYALALEQLLGRRPDRALVYALALGDALPL